LQTITVSYVAKSILTGLVIITRITSAANSFTFCVAFIVCKASFIVCVALCAVLIERVVSYCNTTATE
jgi:hypothetical protein